jgi:hypothetical protein
MDEGWRDWILESKAAVRVGRTVCVVAAVGFVAAAAIILANFARGRGIPGVAWLLAPAIPALVAGQLWGIAVLLSRRDPIPAGGGLRAPWLAAGSAEQRLVAGVFAGFFSVHLGMAAAELRRRRRAPLAAEPVA